MQKPSRSSSRSSIVRLTSIPLLAGLVLALAINASAGTGYALIDSITSLFGVAAPTSESARSVSQDGKPAPAVLRADGKNPSDFVPKALNPDATADDGGGSTTTPPGPDAVNNYPVTRTTGITYTSIVGSGTNITSWRNGLSTDDNMSNSQPIGFNFVYNGVVYQNFLVSTNGFITMNTGTAAVGGSTAPYNFQNTNFYTSGSSCSCLAIAPFYDDLQTAANLGTAADLNASIQYTTTGAVGSRILTVEWLNMQDFSTSSTASLNFQIKVYESDGHIEFQYGTMTTAAATWSYTDGINASALSATPTATELLMQTTANTNTFSNTPLAVLTTIPATNTKITFAGTAAPNAPTGFTVAYSGSTSVGYSWTDNASNELGYALYLSSDGGTTFSLLGTLAANSTSITITGLLPSSTYTFRTQAVTESMASTPLDGVASTTAAISGTKTVGAGGNYPSLFAAVNDINGANSVASGGVTFTLAAGSTFAENGTCITGGSSTAPITFQRTGAGANP